MAKRSNNNIQKKGKPQSNKNNKSRDNKKPPASKPSATAAPAGKIRAKQNLRKNKPGKRKVKSVVEFNSALKTGDVNDLKSELKKIGELNRLKPLNNMKNKNRRKELVFLRNSMKNKIKGKLRRKSQKLREELGDEAPAVNIPQTIETLREKDDNVVDLENDDEIHEENKNDEYSSYFNKEYDPQVLITTSIKHTASIFKFVKELKDVIPNSYFYYRKQYNLKDIVESAKEKGFTDIIVVYERLKKPYRMVITHLPNGPTVELKLSNVIYSEQIYNNAKSTNHHPELIMKNFSTKTGYRLSRVFNALFPHSPEYKGREVVTFHNQRDFIFFRHHRFIFTEDFERVKLQEIGPRFTARLLSIQKGTFDREFGEYEYVYKDKMGVRRRKFNL
jgi:ribosome production factor 1